MARISTYPIISTPTVDDLLIGTDVNDLNITKNFTIGEIGQLIGQDYVPYIGATGNVNLGLFNITADKFIVGGGTASQFLKADGSLDNTSYTPQTRTLTINGTTYNLSANRSWNLNTLDSLTTIGTGGAATYIGKVLNIPVYQAQGDYITQLSGEATAVGPGNATVTLDNTAVISKILSGLNVTGGTILATDTILQAFGKVQNQINALAGGVEYQGTWNAATNTPFLQSSVGVQGHYYVVNVAGNTNLNGVTDWQVGDWAIYNGSAWEKVDNTDAVVSVNGYTGAVVLTSSDVGAVPTTRTITINGVGYNLNADRSWTVGDVRTDQSYINPSWIASLAWSKITGTPTTLAGYGITDGALNTRTLTINGTTYDLTANRTWNVGTVTSIGTSGPLTGGTITGSGTIGITQAGASSDGYLSSSDWNTFNSKQSAFSTTAPLTFSLGVLGITQATATIDGYLSSTDWATFNSKVGGSGTANTLPMWGTASSLINSPLSYAADAFNFQYNSATGGTVNFTNIGLTPYTYSIQMNNFGSPRSTVHSYTDGVVIQSIAGSQVSRIFADGNLILGTSSVNTGHKLTISGDLYVDTIVNAIADTDRFIVSDGGIIKYRTGAEILSDIGAQGALTLTTIGTSGPATLISNTLNIPDYGSALTGYVPYTGATQNVNLGEFGISAGYFQADLTPTQAAGVGRLIWNNADGTLNLRLLGGNVDLHLGQQQYARIVNGTGGNVLRSNYQVVKIIGAQGQRMQVGLARADNDFNSKDTIGLIAENINNNNEGFVVSSGLIEEINTTGSLQGETWTDGDTLYLSGTIFGALTNIKPTAPIHTVIVGFVVYAHANHGKIFVKVDNGYELEELHDVSAEPFVNNGLLYRDTTLNLWKSATISTILGYTPAPQGNYITSLTGEATASGPGAASVTLSNSAVTGKVLTGLNITGNAILSTDSILTAFGKLQNQVNQLVGGLMYEGTWNASTNTPTITSSVGTDGTFYIVNVAGTTNINGINDWQVGDWIVFHDTTWQKVDNTDSVSSVFGRVGNIVANQSDYSAFYPLISDIKDGILTVQGSGVLSGSGTFSANQATNNTITLTHAAVSRTDTTSAQAPSFGGSFTAIDSVTSSAEGHITAINTKTITVPSTIATATQAGLLSSADWITFNGKQNAITLTTTGTTGPATLIGATLNIPNYTPDLSGYVTLGTDQTITGLKTILRGGDVLNFKIGTDTLYGLKVAYNQNELVPSGEATWSFVNTFNRNGVGYETTPISFFRGVLVTGERLLSASINTNLLDYYSNNPSGRYPVYAYNTGVQQFSTGIIVGNTTGVVNAVTGAIADLPAGVVANFNGRVIGGNAVNSNEFVTLSQVSGYVPTSRTITINGTTQDLSANRTFNVGTVTSVTASSPLASSGGTTPNITIQQATATQNGFLSSTDWTTFNNKQNTITLTTTGTSGAATLVGSTLNIPQYQSVLTNPITGTGTTNYLPKFTSSTTIGNSALTDNGSTLSYSGVFNFTSGKFYSVTNGSGQSYELYVDAGDGANAWRHIYGGTGTGYGVGVGGYGVYYDGNSAYNAIFNPSGFVTFEYSARSPVFFDSQNTAFYADFNSTGTSINIAGSLNAATFNKPAILVNSSGTSSSGAALGMQQVTGEGWTGIFVDFEPYTGWGFYHDNPNNYFLFTSEDPTGAIGGGYSVPSRSSGNRTAYTKFRVDQGTGDITVGRVATAQQDMRAPAFIDSQNTAFYLDPNATSISSNNAGGAIFRNIQISSASLNDTIQNVNSGGNIWLNYGHNGPVGLGYGGGLTTAYAGLDVLNGKLRLQSDSGGYGQFQINSSSTTIESTIVFGSGGSGQNSGQYTYAGVIGLGAYGNSKANFYFGAGYSGPAMYIPNSDSNVYAINSFRAPIFYDSNNTAYYFDGASTTNINTLHGNGKEVMLTSDSYLRINQSNTFTGGTWFGSTLIRQDGFYAGSNGGTTTSRVAIQSGSYNGTNVIDINGSNGIITVSGDMRAPIFYDSNNTGYYTNPASSSRMSSILLDDSSTTGGVNALTFAPLSTPLANAGYVPRWYPMTYQVAQYGDGYRTHLNTGLFKSIAGWGSGQTGWYAAIGGNDSFPTEEWRLTYGGVLTHSYGYVTIGGSARSPIFYDSDDTFYFLDPNSTSRLSTVTAYGEYGSYRNDTQSILRSYNTSAGSPLQFFIDHGYGDVSIGNNRGAVYAYGSFWQVANSVRSLLFYDSSDTSFYIDPNSSSRVFQLDATSWLRAVNGSVIATGIGGSMTMTASTTTFGAYLRTSGHMVLDQSNTGYNVYVLDGNSVGVVKNAGSQSWSAFSDGTIKTVHSTMEDNLLKLESITPIYYSFNNFEDDKNRIGLIAQEVQEHFPELVEVEPRTKKLTLDYTGLIPVLLGAIKELKNEVETLKTKQ